MTYPRDFGDDWEEVGGLLGAPLFAHNANWNVRAVEGGIESTMRRIRLDFIQQERCLGDETCGNCAVCIYRGTR